MAKQRRSLIKAFSYRLFATSVLFAIAFRYTGQFVSPGRIGLTAAVAKTALYCVWERVWSHIDWGTEAP